MIRRTESIEIELTPTEIAEAIMDMSDDEQVDVLRELANNHTFHFPVFAMQLGCIGEVIDGLLPVDKERIKRMFESFVEYIEAIDWEGGDME